MAAGYAVARRDPDPFGIDFTKPNIARVYDAFLGGKDNFAADRAVVEQTLQITSDAAAGAVANRGFLRRAVRYLARDAGLRQFIDIGSGLPAQGNVHEVAHEIDPRTRVVYVDNDPVVHRHSQALVAHREEVLVLAADARRPADILDDPGVRAFVDFSLPVGLLMFGILHHILDEEDPAGIVAQFRAALAPGSHLAISSFRMPGQEHPEDHAKACAVQDLFGDTLGTGIWREDREILGWFGDWALIEPGLVPLPEWRPDSAAPPARDSTYYGFVGGVAAKH
ncbi:SAM-dependent methyltransferase [Trebonia sp.]|uniref:SAM-dependent methyltransferase n=1 Tax=Trebonia sp. TaxID=2767075 RepID=UPI002621BA46|nr:SAM-dependent methyltransferase [Trebonia sp.]